MVSMSLELLAVCESQTFRKSFCNKQVGLEFGIYEVLLEKLWNVDKFPGNW
jgi:hypothetical protein